jgi:hypothetical protein
MKKLLIILAGALLLSCEATFTSTEDFAGEYVCTDVVVSSESLSSGRIKQECRNCHDRFVGTTLNVKPTGRQLWIGFSKQSGGHFTRNGGNKFRSGENTVAQFTDNKLVINCQEAGYNYQILCSKR